MFHDEEVKERSENVSERERERGGVEKEREREGLKRVIDSGSALATEG